MMISLCRTGVTLIVIAVISGCSSFGNNEPEYLASVETEPLKIPPGLDRPTSASPILISVPEMRMPTGDELEPAPPRVVSTAGQKDRNAYIAWSAEGAYLLVKDEPESVVRRLRAAIENSGMSMLEVSESGAHKFHYTQAPPESADEGFFSSMANLRDDGQNTRVYLQFGTGEPVDVGGAEHILGIFMERLG